MKILVRNNLNRAEEVVTRAQEELALAKLIRHRADRDLVQGMKLLKICPISYLHLINGLLHCESLLRLLQSFFGLLRMMEGPEATSSR
jgi:hypothetical protein